jgi:CheY-specific phosphatase CheX
MNPVTADSFAGLAVLALERMAFVVTEPTGDEPQEVLSDCLAHAIVEMRGGENRTLALGLSAEMVRDVASGMMGVEPAEIHPVDHARAAADELANVLAGELVMLLTGGDVQVTLGLPREASAAEVAALLDDGEATRIVLASDTGRALLVVRPDRAA